MQMLLLCSVHNACLSGLPYETMLYASPCAAIIQQSAWEHRRSHAMCCPLQVRQNQRDTLWNGWT